MPYLVCTLEGVLHGIYVVWLTQHKHLPPLTVASLMAATDVALLALELPTGAFADRVGARTSLILGSLAQVLGLALLWASRGVVALGLALLVIAVGDAFRDGAEEALLYRSCAALGLADGFGARIARAHAAQLVALVALTAGGGWLVDGVGFAVGFAVEIALALGGVGIALAFADVAAPNDAREDEVGPWAALRTRLPWARIVPTSMVLALVNAAQFLAQCDGRFSPRTLGLFIAGAQLLEAAGATLVARGLVRATARRLDAVTVGAIAAIVAALLWPLALAPALVALFLVAGIAPAIRSDLLQREAPDGARATITSAAALVDLVLGATILPASARRRRR